MGAERTKFLRSENAHLRRQWGKTVLSIAGDNDQLTCLCSWARVPRRLRGGGIVVCGVYSTPVHGIHTHAILPKVASSTLVHGSPARVTPIVTRIRVTYLTV